MKLPCIFIVAAILSHHLATAAPTSTSLGFREIEKPKKYTQTTLDSWFAKPKSNSTSPENSDDSDTDALDTSVRILEEPSPKLDHEHYPLCKDRLENPKEIDQIKSVRDVIEYLVYRLCQPLVTDEEVDKISAIVDELVKPKDPRIERLKKYKQSTLDSWVTRPKPSADSSEKTDDADADDLDSSKRTFLEISFPNPNAADALDAPSKKSEEMDAYDLDSSKRTFLEISFPNPNAADASDTSMRGQRIDLPGRDLDRDHAHPLCKDRLDNPEQIQEIDDINSLHDVIDYLIYRLCRPLVTDDEVAKIADIVERLSQANILPPIARPHLELDEPNFNIDIDPSPEDDEEPLPLPVDADSGAKDTAEQNEKTSDKGDEVIDDNELRRLIGRRRQNTPKIGSLNGPLKQTSGKTPRLFELDEMQTLREIVKSADGDSKSSDVNLPLIHAMCSDREVNPERIRNIADIESLNDVMEYLVYRLCKASASGKDLAKTSAIAAKVLAVINSLPKKEKDEAIDQGDEADELRGFAGSNKMYDLREIVKSALTEDGPSALCNDRQQINPETIRTIADIRNLLDVIDYLIYNLCKGSASADQVAKITKIAAMLAAVVDSKPKEEEHPIIGYPNPFAEEKPTLVIEPLPEAELKPLPLPNLEDFNPEMQLDVYPSDDKDDEDEENADLDQENREEEEEEDDNDNDDDENDDFDIDLDKRHQRIRELLERIFQ